MTTPNYVGFSPAIAEFYSLLQTTIEQSKATHTPSGMLLIDINNLAIILHLNGREFVDDMINRIIKELRITIVKTGSFFRVQRNHLAVILPDCSVEDMQVYADKIHQRIRALSCELPNTPIYIAPFIGGVDFLDDVIDASDALDKVYIALKNTEHLYNRYYSSYRDAKKELQNHKNKMVLANCMEDALLHRKLRLAFQPIIDSKTGATSHHECLLRIISEDGKLVSVGPFIPVVEEMGFIDEVDELVLEMVCQELRDSPNISLAFNLSSIGIENPNWMRKAKILFKDPELASRAIIEITETAAQKDISQASRFVTTMQDMGCLVALDDFGAGHTSFRQLKDLPVDIIKIDGSFIRDIVDNYNNRLFVKTLLDISKGFGLKAVAEFVETGEIAKLLMELKVDYMQGNYFSPAVNYRSWVQE